MSALSLNQVVLAGYLTRDPVLRKLPSGQSVAEMGLAIGEKYTSKAGVVIDQTCFVEIVSWAKIAESASAYLHKGDGVIVEGVLAYDSWQNDKGEKRSRLRVRARRLHFVGSRRKDGGEPPTASDPVPAEVAAEHDAVLAADGATDRDDAMPF